MRQLHDLLAVSGRRRFPALITAGAAGAGLVATFAPFGAAWLAPLLLAVLILLWNLATTPREAAWLGFCFGLGLFSAGTYWLYISLNILGGLWPPLALLLMLGLIVAMATYVAATGALVVWVAPAAGAWPRWLLAIPAAWILFEWLRGWLFTGFPWLSVGYAFGDGLLGAYAPLAGVYGVSWVVMLLAGAVAALVLGSVRVRLVAALLASALLVSAMLLQQQSWTRPSGPELRVTLVQGAVPQELKWRPEQLQPTLDLYRDLSFTAQPQDLLIWPEAAVPALPFEIPEFLDELQDALLERDTSLFTGILTYDLDRGQYMNTLWALGPEPGMYHKRHLVAFGEYFPLPQFATRWLRIMNLPSESIASGDADQPLLTVRGQPVAATICYELAFGAEQLRFLPQATLLVNVSNDGWFGDSIAPHQHLQIGQMRARETGRFLLRATNTGITAVIAPDGEVRQRLPQFVSGTLDATVLPYTAATPYVRWGNRPLLGLAIVLLTLAAILTRRIGNR